MHRLTAVKLSPTVSTLQQDDWRFGDSGVNGVAVDYDARDGSRNEVYFYGCTEQITGIDLDSGLEVLMMG